MPPSYAVVRIRIRWCLAVQVWILPVTTYIYIYFLFYASLYIFISMPFIIQTDFVSYRITVGSGSRSIFFQLSRIRGKNFLILTYGYIRGFLSFSCPFLGLCVSVCLSFCVYFCKSFYRCFSDNILVLLLATLGLLLVYARRWITGTEYNGVAISAYR